MAGSAVAWVSPTGGGPVPSGPSGAERVTRPLILFGLGVFALLLTLYLAYQSSELHDADLALREYQDLVNEHPQEKLYEAWKLYHFEQVYKLKPPTAPLDEYQKLAETTRDLGQKRSAIVNLLLDASVLHIVPRFLPPPQCIPGEGTAAEKRADDAGCRPAGDYDPSNPDDAHSYTSGESFKGEPAQAGAHGSDPTADRAICDHGAADGHPCPASKPSPTGAQGTTGLAKDPAAATTESFDEEIARILTTLDLAPSDFNYPLWPAIYDTRHKVNLLVAWLLPGLYGLLGACVYIMRDQLQRGSEHFERGMRAFDILTLLLRITLGGLAGIIVGWFWVPNSDASSPQTITISSVSFGVAFLAGFSIDTLFHMLDRLNSTIGVARRDREPKRRGA